MRSDRVVFNDESLERAFESLSEDDPLKKGIKKAIEEIRENCQAGEHISPKSILAKNYMNKFIASNIRVYDLPLYYRLIYSISSGNIEIVSVILDWKNHKEYEKLSKKEI